MNLKNIRSIILSRETRSGRIFDYIIQSIIILSIILYSLSTLPSLSDELLKLLEKAEVVITIILSIEYILRITVSEKKLSYIFSFYGMIDLIAILPFYLSLSSELLSLRIFRLLRLFRSLKFFRYNDALRRYNMALKSIRTELALFFSVAAIFIYISAVGIYMFESEVQPEKISSVFDGLWWAVITLTTVGYGDVYPITSGGKVFTSILSIIGVGIVAIPTGLFASALTNTKKPENKSE